jgi:anti-sigma regulatory factor (Ser/Thr protein kinase)
MDHDEPRGAGLTTRRFARAAPSVGVIRAWLRDSLGAARVTSDVVDVAELLVSEVATNAVDHGAGDEIVVRVTSDGQVETAVHDQGTTGTPCAGEAAPDAVRGRGLGLVQALASSWGVHPTRTGKWVWFRLATQPGDSADPCARSAGRPLHGGHGEEFPDG